jgi:ParB family transcriptional regulator, chromosome partitioning protein
MLKLNRHSARRVPRFLAPLSSLQPHNGGVSATVQELVLHVEHELFAAQMIATDSICPNPYQPRTVFDPDDLQGLIDSVRDNGILQPILVRPHGDHYELIAGERRWRAACALKLTAIPAVTRNVSDKEMLQLAIIENVQRANLNLIEQAHAVARLIAETGATQTKAAALLSISRARVTHLLGLLRLADATQRRIAAGVITFGHAKLLIGIPSPQEADQLAERIVREGLTVRNTEEIITLGRGARAVPQRSRDPRRGSASPPGDLSQVAEGLGRWLDTRVKVKAGRARGRIVVEFADLTDMDRILTTMGVPDQLLPEVD